MKKVMGLLFAGLLLAASPGLAADKAMPTEGVSQYTIYYAGNHEMQPFDQSRAVVTYENWGVRVNDGGKGPLHHASTHNVGVIFFDKGTGKLRGYVTAIDTDGDKLLTEINEDKAMPTGMPTKGKGTIVGGTGKFAGMQGTMEYIRDCAKPIEPGTHQCYSRGTSTWKLPKKK